MLGGQLCYKLTLRKTSGPDKVNELMLLLDYNEDLSLHTSPSENRNVQFSKEKLNLDTAIDSVQYESAKIQMTHS